MEPKLQALEALRSPELVGHCGHEHSSGLFPLTPLRQGSVGVLSDGQDESALIARRNPMKLYDRRTSLFLNSTEMDCLAEVEESSGG